MFGVEIRSGNEGLKRKVSVRKERPGAGSPRKTPEMVTVNHLFKHSHTAKINVPR